MAGFDELLAIDFDAHAEATFTANFPGVPFWRRDIASVSAEEILSFTGLEGGGLDVLDGSPPCQGFSMAGKRQVDDGRNLLFEHYVRLIRGLRPKVFVMENVPGMAAGKMRSSFNIVLGALKDTEYNVRCMELNAAYYGVPQARRRLFFIGVRPDIGVPHFPVPSSGPLPCGPAIDAVVNTQDELDWAFRKCATPKTMALVRLLRRGESARKYHARGMRFSLYRLDPSKPANTIIKENRAGANPIHWASDRSLTVSECKAVCGFPPEFKLEGHFDHQWARLGNAVMPPMMAAVARTLREKVLGG